MFLVMIAIVMIMMMMIDDDGDDDDVPAWDESARQTFLNKM